MVLSKIRRIIIVKYDSGTGKRGKDLSHEKIKTAEINPFVRYVDQASFTPICRSVRAYDHRLFFMRYGECHLEIEGKGYNLKADSLAVIRPGDSYTFGIVGKFDIIDINFDYTQEESESEQGVPPSFANEFDETKMFNKPVFADAFQLNNSFVIHNMGEIRNELSMLVEEFNLKRVLYREKASGFLKNVLYDILRSFYGNDSAMKGNLDMVLNYIRNNYDKELSNEQLAEMVGYHSYYLNRLMKAYTGTTLHQYIIECRIDSAKSLLVNTHRSIEEIAETCGFKNMAHFSDCFKRKTGISAASFRRNSKQIL